MTFISVELPKPTPDFQTADMQGSCKQLHMTLSGSCQLPIQISRPHFGCFDWTPAIFDFAHFDPPDFAEGCFSIATSRISKPIDAQPLPAYPQPDLQNCSLLIPFLIDEDFQYG